MTKVKICGITNLEDARRATEFGADMLGFNFYEKSSRFVLAETASAIAKQVPDCVEKVGVFVNMPVQRISELVDLVGLTAVQLHGDEDRMFVERLSRLTDVPMIKAVRVSEDFQPGSVTEYQVDAILLDAYSANQYGGTGDRFDWSIAAAVRRSVSALYLAGGLTPDNVAKAIRQVRPFAVDVASGVESSPGKKDPEKVEAFIRNAKHA